MAQQELNLLQLAASGSAQAGATSAEIVRRKLGHADLGGKFFDDMPDELLSRFHPKPYQRYSRGGTGCHW